MTRGRPKDLTIPPTRALLQQRDYRARRAQYISDLEERVRKAEAENDGLRRELAIARTRPAPPDPQAALASAELELHLSMVSASLSRFHNLAFVKHHHPYHDTRPPARTVDYRLPRRPLDSRPRLRPATFPSYSRDEQSSEPYNDDDDPVAPRRRDLWRKSPEPIASSSHYSRSKGKSRPSSSGSSECSSLSMSSHHSGSNRKSRASSVDSDSSSEVLAPEDRIEHAVS